MQVFNNEYFMNLALNEARTAFEKDEIPVGAIVVCKNQVIARAHNMSEQLTDATAHAEMLALTSASGFLNSKYLKESTIYITLEPCIMCAGAMFWTQISKIVYGATDKKRGFSLIKQSILHPKTKVVSGVLSSESSLLLKKYFQGKRGT